MELIQTKTKTIHQVSAEQAGWQLNASVTVEDGKVTNINGNARQGAMTQHEPYEDGTTFYGSMEGGILRLTYNFRHNDADVCNLLRAMVDAIIARYEL